MMEKSCDICFNSRPVLSENGIHYVCCLSDKKAMDCFMGRKSCFVLCPMFEKERAE